jgi:GTP-binding protein HflX
MVALSATDRESTRLLLKKIAEQLEERWEQARTVPAPVLEEDEAAPPSEPPFPVFEGAESLTTLDELRGGRRRGPSRVNAPR